MLPKERCDKGNLLKIIKLEFSIAFCFSAFHFQHEYVTVKLIIRFSCEMFNVKYASVYSGKSITTEHSTMTGSISHHK